MPWLDFRHQLARAENLQRKKMSQFHSKDKLDALLNYRILLHSLVSLSILRLFFKIAHQEMSVCSENRSKETKNMHF